MLKIAITLLLNVALITAVVTTLYETPETYIEWKIENFFDLPTEINYELRSPIFSLSNNKWYIEIDPNGQTKQSSHGYTGMYLMKSDSEGEYRVDFKMGFKKQDGSEFAAKQAINSFNKTVLNWGWPKFIQRSTLLNSKNALGNTVTVFCKARILNSIEVIPRITSSSGTGTLSDNLKDLYNSKRFTDVRLIVGSREFRAHKIVLSSRSTVFGSMLDNIPDKVEITDCDPDSFEEFLRFLYTGKLVDVSSKKAMGLYNTAEKYNVQDLKEECSQSIAKHNISIDTFYEILRFANVHSDSGLLKASTDFFIANAKFIISTDQWEKFLSNDPLQGNKLFSSYVEKKD